MTGHEKDLQLRMNIPSGVKMLLRFPHMAAGVRLVALCSVTNNKTRFLLSGSVLSAWFILKGFVLKNTFPWIYVPRIREYGVCHQLTEQYDFT